MIKLISKVELLREGKAGFEITGNDVVSTTHSRISDAIIRTRALPVPFWSRKLFDSLKYPVLVYTRHWLPVWDILMDKEKETINQDALLGKEEWVVAKLQNLWRETTVSSIEDTPSGFRIEAKIVMGGKNNSIKALITEDSDANIYMRTKDLFERICEEFVRLMTQNILPSTTEDIKAIAAEIDENMANLTDDEILEKLIDLADKRNMQIGFTVEQFENMLPDHEDRPVIISSSTESHSEFEEVEEVMPED